MSDETTVPGGPRSFKFNDSNRRHVMEMFDEKGYSPICKVGGCAVNLGKTGYMIKLIDAGPGRVCVQIRKKQPAK